MQFREDTAGNGEVGKGGEGKGERRDRGGEEHNKANPFDEASGGGETRLLKNNNQLVILKVSSTSECGGQLRGGKRRQWEREKTKEGGRSTTITCH